METGQWQQAEELLRKSLEKSPEDASTHRSMAEVVWHRGAGPLVGFGGPDVEAPVDLHRVERDDLDIAEGLRDLDGHRGLAGRGGADEGQVLDRRCSRVSPR